MIGGVRETQPLPIPSESASDAPYASIRFNTAWWPFVVGMLSKGLSEGFWDESTGEIQNAWDGIAWMMGEGSQVNAVQYARVREEQASGTNGGGSPTASAIIRTLNTVDGDGSFLSLANNIIDLDAGTYIIQASAPAVRSARHKLSILQFPGNALLIAGTSEFNFIAPSTTPSDRSYANGILESDGTLRIYLHHWFQIGFAGTGLGTPTSSPYNEVYAEIQIWKIG